MDSPEDQNTEIMGLSSLEDQCRSLRRWLAVVLALVVAVQVLMLSFSFTLAVHLHQLSKMADKDLAELRPQVTKTIGDYQKSAQPVFSSFVKKLVEYGRTHPDFMPILTKYGINADRATSPPDSDLQLKE